ncbi:tyrosine-type recombinase/integrase [Neomoorella thermoacetica]|uniref:tyrosine-type recombinase/integrase n=1 Tax=Neomoorella thermoacetica TaxID=1525 RepID=UPI0008FB7FF3|nr:tyrosine-type recombinase/integrase [Moorella thermoacetica]APC09055.1 tyrosine recombinase XerC [Moorella thermoacetica]OIQ54998.1 tyrosine recombinase XerC [Moorella thermoacetica]
MGKGIYANLEQQIEALRRKSTETVSYKTQERYWSAFRRFCEFTASKFRLQNIKNISDKHLEAYIEHLKSQGRGPSHIKTELSGIRYVHDKIENARYKLSSNEKFGLPKRKFGGVDRSWTPQEYMKMREIALQEGNTRAYHILSLCRNAGLRIEEALKINRATAEKALRTGIMHVIGKGGRPRDIKINNEVKKTLAEAMSNTPRGQKLFVLGNEKTHLVKKELEKWMEQNRAEAQAPGRERPLTWHGLRHSYAKERYAFYRNVMKMDKIAARKAVSAEIGHNRADVTVIYTGKED